jgi:hypothetical protein
MILAFPCPQCGLAGAMTCAQTSRGGKLSWYESVGCERCGLQQEADGDGFPPDGLREAFIDEGGLWSVTLTAVRSKPSAIKLLRETLSWDLAKAAQVMKAMPGVAYFGTRAECLWLASLLDAIGQPSDVGRAKQQ